MATKENFELKVGIFVFIGIVILAIIIFSIGDIYFFKPGYHMKAVFGYVNGLEMGAPVRVAGVSVGEIKDVRVYRDSGSGKINVELLMWINKGTKIEKDSKAYINTLGLFGEKYVEITPGDPALGFFKEDETLYGKDPISMERFSEKMEKIAEEVSKTFVSINDVLGDEKAREDLRVTIRDSRVLVEKIQKLTDTTTLVVEKLERGEGTIGKLMKDETIYNNLEGLSADIRQNPWKLLYRPRGAK